jgi:hypothetical protein
MKILLITISLLLPLFAVRAEERPAPAESFATFWAGFKRAVARDDKEAVLAATDLRFFNQKKLAEHLAKAAFIRDYPSYFTKEVKKCFATAKPVRDRDGYVVFCGEEIFGFEKVNGTYKFTSIGMND